MEGEKKPELERHAALSIIIDKPPRKCFYLPCLMGIMSGECPMCSAEEHSFVGVVQRTVLFDTATSIHYPSGKSIPEGPFIV